jgi:hypothetical protein
MIFWPSTRLQKASSHVHRKNGGQPLFWTCGETHKKLKNHPIAGLLLVKVLINLGVNL